MSKIELGSGFVVPTPTCEKVIIENKKVIIVKLNDGFILMGLKNLRKSTYLKAISEISTFTNFGKLPTSTVSRAGAVFVSKYFP